MNTEIKPDKTLDLSGEPCSMVLKKIREALAGLQGGEILEVITTDVCTEFDIPIWVKRSGNEIVKNIDEGDIFRFFIKTP